MINLIKNAVIQILMNMELNLWDFLTPQGTTREALYAWIVVTNQASFTGFHCPTMDPNFMPRKSRRAIYSLGQDS